MATTLPTRGRDTVIKKTQVYPLRSLVIVVCASMFLWPSLFLPNGTPIWSNGDQNLFLLNASRTLEGQLIYRDFFHFLFPGTETVFVSLFKIFGERAWILNVVLIALGVVQTWLIVSISSSVLHGWTSVLPGMLFLVGPYRNRLDATHHWFSSLVVLATILVVIQRRSPSRMGMAGILCGVTLFFTSSRGLVCVLGLAVFLFWEQHYERGSRRLFVAKLASLLSSFVATMAIICGYFVLKVGFRTLWASVVVFPARYYPTGRANTFRAYMTDWPGLMSWTRLPAITVWCLIYALIPFAYVLFMIRYRQERTRKPAEPWDRLMLLNVVGCSLFCGIVTAPNFLRLCSVSAPALVLSVWLIKGTKYHSIAMKGILIWALALAMVESLPSWFHTSFVLDLPVGPLGFRGEPGSNEYAWLAQRTHPFEYFFDSAARVYFPLRLRDPSRIPYIANTAYTTVEQVQDVIHSLDAKQVKFVSWRWYLDVPEDPSDTGDNLGPLREYLSRHYHVARRFSSGDVILEREEQSP